MADKAKNDVVEKRGPIMLNDLSVNDLKAMAYDEGVKIDVARNNLQVLNQEIANRQKPIGQKPAEVTPIKKEEK